jgi:hypothetical protein
MIEIVPTVDRRAQFRAALVDSLLAELDADSVTRGATIAFVDDRLARIGGVLRLATLGVEGVLCTSMALVAGARCVESPAAGTLLRRLNVTGLPVIADYVHLVRTLVVVFVHETRPAHVVSETRSAHAVGAGRR